MSRASRGSYYFSDEYDIKKMRNKLYALRVGYGLAQDEAANKLGVSKSSYSRAENGSTMSLSKKVVDAAISYYNLKPEELIIPLSKPAISVEFENWIDNREVSEPYLKRAYTQYLKDNNKF